MGLSDKHKIHPSKPIKVPEPAGVKSRLYKVTFETDRTRTEHLIEITLKEEWYSVTIKFSKPLTDKQGLTFRESGFSAKDLSIVKKLIRDFLKRFGNYKITPL